MFGPKRFRLSRGQSRCAAVLLSVALFGALTLAGSAPAAEPIPAIKTPNPGLIYSTATGDPGASGYFPLAAVRWLTPPRDIAALVTESRRDRLTAELFHFGPAPRTMSAELYLLAPGRYTWQLLEDGKPQPGAAPRPLVVNGPKARITFRLPPARLCELRIQRVP